MPKNCSGSGSVQRRTISCSSPRGGMVFQANTVPQSVLRLPGGFAAVVSGELFFQQPAA